MSDTHKTTLTRANAAITEGRYEDFLAFCTDDTEWTFVGDQTLHGKQAVREWMATAYTEPPRFKVDQLIAEGDELVAIGEITLKNQEGRDVRHRYCDVWTFHDGKMAALRAFVVPV